MKKFDLVYITILIVALMLGYSAIGHLLGILSDLSYIAIMGSDHYPIGNAIILDITLALLFLACSILLIKKGRGLATAILKDEPEDSREELPQLQLDRYTLIFVLFIGMGLYTLIQSLPFVITDTFALFRNKVSVESFRIPEPNRDKLIIELLKVVLGIFLIYIAPTFARFIDKQAAVRNRGDA